MMPAALAAAEDEGPLEILYQDERYVAVRKPAGMLVHRTTIDTGETRIALQLLRDQLGQKVYPIHRLDRPTSGILLFALDPQSLAALAAQFENRRVRKRYLAVARGHAPESGVIDYPLARFTDDDAREKSDQTQEAITRYVRLAASELPYPTDRYETTRLSLLELWPLTGRRHQLRRHLAHISHPIIGDTRHGDSKLNIAAREHSNIQRLLLAATDLWFEHPFTQAEVHLRCPPDPSFQNALKSTQLEASPL